MRDYDKPLTIVLTGTGNSTKANTEALLENYIFGNVDGDVEVHMIVPFTEKPKTGLETAIKIMKESFGVNGKDFTPVVEPQGGSNLLASAEASHQVQQGLAVWSSMDLLAKAKDSGHDTAVICLYDPNSVADFDVIDTAKTMGFTTLNLSEGLIDSFQDYESREDKAKRKALEEAHVEEETTEKPVKKATTPRKRAAKKAAAPVPTSEPVEPEKPVQTFSGASKDSSSLQGTAKLVAMAVEREAAKKVSRPAPKSIEEFEEAVLSGEIGGPIVSPEETDVWPESLLDSDAGYGLGHSTTELSGTIVLGSKLPDNLEPVKDIQQDLAKAAPPMWDHVSVTKSDIVQLGDAMEKMASGFADAIAIYKKIVETI